MESNMALMLQVGQDGLAPFALHQAHRHLLTQIGLAAPDMLLQAGDRGRCIQAQHEHLILISFILFDFIQSTKLVNFFSNSNQNEILFWGLGVLSVSALGGFIHGILLSVGMIVLQTLMVLMKKSMRFISAFILTK